MRICSFYMKTGWVFILVVTLVFTSCSKADEPTSPCEEPVKLKSASISSNNFFICNPQNIELIAGKDYHAGNVNVLTNSDGKLIVSVATQDGWMLKTMHLFVGGIAYLPMNKSGNPVIGNFPVSNSYFPFQDADNFEFELTGLTIDNNNGQTSVMISLQAEVGKFINGKLIQSETAWVGDTPFSSKGGRAVYFNYGIMPCGGGGALPPGSN